MQGKKLNTVDNMRGFLCTKRYSLLPAPATHSPPFPLLPPSDSYMIENSVNPPFLFL